MKISRTKTSVTFKGVSNESQADDIWYAADRAKCKVVGSDYQTTQVVTGTEKQLEKFVKLYNN